MTKTKSLRCEIKKYRIILAVLVAVISFCAFAQFDGMISHAAEATKVAPSQALKNGVVTLGTKSTVTFTFSSKDVAKTVFEEKNYEFTSSDTDVIDPETVTWTNPQTTSNTKKL